MEQRVKCLLSGCVHNDCNLLWSCYQFPWTYLLCLNKSSLETWSELANIPTCDLLSSSPNHARQLPDTFCHSAETAALDACPADPLEWSGWQIYRNRTPTSKTNAHQFINLEYTSLDKSLVIDKMAWRTEYSRADRLLSSIFIIPKRIITISVASLDTLTSEALRIINTHPTPHKTHTYFIAGIPGITSRIRGVGYEEVIFIDNVKTAHHNFMTQVKHTKETIASTNSIPCFATVAPMSLYTWNTTRMDQHKTQYLIHHNYYEDMQSL